MSKFNSNLKWKYIFILAFIFVGVSQNLWAQRTTIKGTVKSDDGEALPGVTIVAKDVKSLGAATDFDGNFEIKVPAKVKTLIFSYVGFETQNVDLNGKTTINVVLKTDSNELEEVVVIGYGTQLRKDVTGAIASVKSEDLERTVNQNFGDALQGKVAGVQVTSEDGIPGGGFKVNIRGASSITGSTQPLYVVDGFPIEVFSDNVDNDTGYEGGGSSDPLDFLDPSLIESVELLRDASATAIYGARGANGVVIITTKQGKAGTTRIDFSSSFSLSQVPDERIPNLFSRDEIFDYQTRKDYYDPDDNRSWNETTESWEYLKQLDEFTLDNPYSDDEEDKLNREEWNSLLYDTDWPRALLRTGSVANYVLSISGGDEGNLYNFSGSFLQNEGVVVGSGYDRFVFNVNLKNRLSKRLNMQTSLSPSFSKQYGTGGGGGSVRNSWGLFSRAMNTPAYTIPGDADGIENDWDDDENSYSDPVYQAENEINNTLKYGFRGITKLSYKIVDGLTANVDVGIKYDTSEGRKFNPPTFGQGAKPAIMGQASRIDKKQISFTNDNTLNYNKKFGKKHRLDAVVGFTQQSKQTSTYTQKARQFDLDVEDGSIDFDLAGFYYTPKVREQEIKQNGLLARANYVFNNKYSITGTIRRDGDSRFNKDNRYRSFPSASFAWTMSNENFLINSKVVDNWKWRFSYGKAGNSGTRPRDSREAFVVSDYTFGGELYTGYGSKLLVDKGLTWQSTLQYNIGTDISLFNNRINLVADAYLRQTTDMILDQPLPPNTGYSYIRTNSGDLDNWGYEMTLKTDNIRKNNFNWSTNFTFAVDRSKVLSLNGPEYQVFASRLDSSNPVILKVGENVGTWMGYQMDGVYNSWEEIEASPITKNIRGVNLQPGDPKYVDMNGDDRISDDDLTIIARTTPKFHGGLWNNFTIKNFDFGFFFTFKSDFDVINGDKFKHTYHSRGGGNMMMSYALENAWSPDNSESEHPGYHFDAGSTTAPFSSYHVEDGSFIRLQNINMSYNIPKNVLENSFIRSCKILFSITNAYLWTKYSGSDPENSVSRGQQANLAPNLDWGAYPRTRNWTTSVKIGF